MSLSEKIEQCKEVLNAQHFVCIDAGVTPEEKQSLENVNIEKALAQFNGYGPVDYELEKKISDYLKEMGQNSKKDIDNISKMIVRISSEMLRAFNNDWAWTMVRVTMPNHLYDIPRWHSDGTYFKHDRKLYKLVMTLKGPHTLFGKAADIFKYKELMEQASKNTTDNWINNKNSAKYDEEDMLIRTKLVKVVELSGVCKDGEAGIYLVGDPNAAIHSEPPKHTPRIFISVLTGFKEQIEEWANRNTKY